MKKSSSGSTGMEPARAGEELKPARHPQHEASVALPEEIHGDTLSARIIGAVAGGDSLVMVMAVVGTGREEAEGDDRNV